MSKGWESKSVEEQQAEQAQAAEARAKGQGPVGGVLADAEARRRRQALELQRERILSEVTSSPHRRSALSAALLDIEERLGELGWSIHM